MNDFLELMRTSILGAMPQTFTYLLFVASFLSPQPPRLVRRIAAIAAIHSLYTDTLQTVLPFPLHILNSFLAQMILIWFVFRDLSAKQKIGTFLFTNIFSILLDVITLPFLKYGLRILDRDALLHDQFWRFLPILYLELAFILVAAWFIRRRNLFSLRRYFSLLLDGTSGALSKIIILLVIQFSLLGFLPMVGYAGEKYRSVTFNVIIYLVIAVSFMALFLIVKLLIRTRQLAIQSTQDVYVEDINRMFASIRGQRHDFINHLQVIHSLTQMGKIEELRRYVRALVDETREMSEIVNHSFPALAAFVQAKTAVAVAKGIAFSFELPTQPVEDDNSIRTIDVIKILGNLVDNAFDEVSGLPAGSRFVHASVKYAEGKVWMEVSNRGKTLNPEEREKILSPGYTTKTDGKHSGLGLAIVAERTQHYGGTLEIDSKEQTGTSFRVAIPLKPLASFAAGEATS